MKENKFVIYSNTSLFKEKFKCHRCGYCCYHWAVILPNGETKPENTICKHLKYDLDKEKAYCEIYENRPLECKLFYFCPYSLFDDDEKKRVREIIKNMIIERDKKRDE